MVIKGDRCGVTAYHSEDCWWENVSGDCIVEMGSMEPVMVIDETGVTHRRRPSPGVQGEPDMLRPPATGVHDLMGIYREAPWEQIDTIGGKRKKAKKPEAPRSGPYMTPAMRAEYERDCRRRGIRG